jgi:hypothetical protein
VLAVNAAKDATELVAKLCAYHHNAQTKADKQHLSGYVSNESRKMLPLCKLKVYSRLSENVQQYAWRGLYHQSRFLNSFKPSMGVKGLTTERR